MSGKFTMLLGSTHMTPIERAAGRFMRAPDHDAGSGTGDAEFDKFAAAGEVEVGKPAIETNAEPEAKPAKPAARSGKGPREKPADDGAEKPGKAAADKAAGKDKPGADDKGGEGDEDGDGEGAGDEEEDEDEPEPERKPKKASERIRELTQRVRQRDRLIDSLSGRLDALEKGGLPANRGGGNTTATDKPAPDPSDESKYPLGHLDDRYIEDKLEWLAEQKAAERADAALQREQGREQEARAQQEHVALLEKVDDLTTRGSEKYDDFQEAVVDAGMRGDWRLERATFEAAHEAENGAQILYELSQDKKEAARVAGLSDYQQMRFVMDRDAEITAKSKPRTKPGAGEPPATQTRGANSSARINPATDNLDDFEKAWVADAKGK